MYLRRYNSDQWHLPQKNGVLPFAPTRSSWYQYIFLAAHPVTFFPPIYMAL